MNISNPDTEKKQSVIKCHVCNKELDYVTASVSQDISDAIYLCFGSVKQKIFVYGKYLGGKYGAISFAKYITKGDCEEKICEHFIAEILKVLGETEYSRFITCNRGMMNSIIVTNEMVSLRKKALSDRILCEVLNDTDSEKNYFCHTHAEKAGFKCQCGEELININSEKYRDIMGMEDQRFIETYIPDVILKNPYEKPCR